jgi:hypothetical protein
MISERYALQAPFCRTSIKVRVISAMSACGTNQTFALIDATPASDPKQTYRVFSCSEAVDLIDQRRQRRSNLVVKSPGYLLPPNPVSY